MYRRVFAGEHLVSLEQRGWFFVVGVKRVRLLDCLCRQRFDRYGVGGAGDHDLQHVEVLAQGYELRVHGISFSLEVFEWSIFECNIADDALRHRGFEACRALVFHRRRGDACFLSTL